MTEAINIIGQGITDPHIHIFADRAYLYASHDYSSENQRFDMRDWQVWSSDGLLKGRHGNFFEWKDKWYFTYCEMAFSGNRYFRDFWISHVNYAADGSILPIRVESRCIA